MPQRARASDPRRTLLVVSGSQEVPVSETLERSLGTQAHSLASTRLATPYVDPIADPLQRTVRSALESVPIVADLLRGQWLGHPLHAAASDVPVGAWITAVTLDALAAVSGVKQLRVGADAAVGIGLAGTAVVIASGFADWSAVEDPQAKRLGFVHGVLNLGVTALMAGSLFCRLTSRRRAGVTLSAAGVALASLTAWIGGEMAFGRGVGLRARVVA